MPPPSSTRCRWTSRSSGRARATGGPPAGALELIIDPERIQPPGLAEQLKRHTAHIGRLRELGCTGDADKLEAMQLNVALVREGAGYEAPAGRALELLATHGRVLSRGLCEQLKRYGSYVGRLRELGCTVAVRMILRTEDLRFSLCVCRVKVCFPITS
jgi:hypothetical protein